MSTVAFGALSTRREQSDSGMSTSEQPPGLSTYVDILAALVPAEVLAINSIVVAATAQAPPGQVTLADTGTYRWMFGLLLTLAAVLFVLGRRPAPALDPGSAAGPAAEAGGQAAAAAVGQQNPNSSTNWRNWQNWEWQDLIRLLIAPAAYVCWTMIEPSGVWSAIVPGMSSGTRLMIPMVGAAALGAIAKALASHADKKPSPAQGRAAAERHAAQRAAQLPAPDPVPGPTRPIVPAPAPPAPAPPAPAPDGASEDEPVEPAAPTGSTDNADVADTAGTTDAPVAATVPSWVY